MPGDSSRGQEYSIFSISALSLKDWSKLTTHGRSLLPWKFTNRTDRIFRKPHEPNPAALEQGTHDAPTLTWVFQIWERNDKRREHLWMESQASSLCVSLAHKSGDGSRNFTGADFDPIAVVREFGYSELEARFLCVVAQYSGYFTRRQFLAFTGKTKGWAVHNFTEKLLARGHATVTPLGHGIHLFRLCSRQIYDELDRSSLRIRSTCSDEFIRARLLTLDFVMAHPAANYLQTSSEKQTFFTDKMGLPTTILPGKVYSGIPSLECKLRYFTDRFPIFLESQDAAQSGLQSPVFVYCDAYEKGLDAFKTHLQRYQPLFKRLARFRYMYASPQPRRFARARRLFDSLMPKHTQGHARTALLLQNSEALGDRRDG